MPLNIEPQYGQGPDEESIPPQDLDMAEEESELDDEGRVTETEESNDESQDEESEDESALAETGYARYNGASGAPPETTEPEEDAQSDEEQSDPASQIAKSSLKWWIMGSSCGCLLSMAGLILVVVIFSPALLLPGKGSPISDTISAAGGAVSGAASAAGGAVYDAANAAGGAVSNVVGR